MSTLPVDVAMPLPFCLRLEDGDYKIRYKGRVYLCRLCKVWSDFASGCNPDKDVGPISTELLFKVTTGQITKALNCEIEFDKKGFFRYTVFSTRVYFDEGSELEEIVDRVSKDPLIVIRTLLPLINKLLVAYRYVTGEFHVTEIQWPDLCMVRDGKMMPWVTMDYPTRDHQRRKVMGWFPGDESPVITTRPNVSKRGHKTIETLMLQKDFQPPLERDLLLNSKDFSRQGRHGLAVFELGTALEIAVNKVLLDKGVDEEELRKLRFKEKYDTALLRYAGVSLKGARNDLWSAVLKIWNIRNNVAHRRLAAFTDRKGTIVERIESKSQVQPLISATEHTLGYLDSIR